MLTRFANPARFERLASRMIPILGLSTVVLFAFGLMDALFLSPGDYQQSEAVRIMYVHVPSAWVAMAVYAACGIAGAIYIVLRHNLAELFIRAAAPVGVVATAVCLATGMLWGAPMWGTWWVWDARLTSVLAMFFLYAGIIALTDAFDRPEQGGLTASWLAVIGLINLPVIKYSVQWWNTLHQDSSLMSIKRMADPALPPEMIRPLLIMGLALSTFAAVTVFMRMRGEIARRRLYVAGKL